MTRVVAIYFPQLHAIPENDRWWGKGFTDWTNVKKAQPLFPGHYQPRVPLDGHYDQSKREVIRRQVSLAREYGVDAFSHYHYWFEGKQLLQTPTNLFLEMKDLKIEFCLSWANETWSRRWDGQDHEILIEQRHTPRRELWEAHFQYLIRAWTDERALRIDGRPLFQIYRPAKIAQLGQMLDYWQTRARAYGIDGIHFTAVCQSSLPPWEIHRHFDSVMLFQPFFAHYSLAARHPSLTARIGGRIANMFPAAIANPAKKFVDDLSRPLRLPYDRTWREIVANRIDRVFTHFEGAFVDWDNTARYGNRAMLWDGATPERFERWMQRLLTKVETYPERQRLVFINAWNEWAEGAYLEPDERHRYAYLEALRRARASVAANRSGARVVAHEAPAPSVGDNGA